jgi:transcriptional antiterminator RfaH
MTPAATQRWYVVQTQPHAERKASLHLARQGFETYLPRYLKRRRHARRIETVVAPLFPRYLFVAVDMATQRWRNIQSTIGVSCLVCNGDEPAALPARVMDQLRSNEDERGFVRVDTRPRFAPGDKVRILDGAFAATMGLFEAVADKDRIAILLDLLGRKVRVVLDVDYVTAA